MTYVRFRRNITSAKSRWFSLAYLKWKNVSFYARWKRHVLWRFPNWVFLIQAETFHCRDIWINFTSSTIGHVKILRKNVSSENFSSRTRAILHSKLVFFSWRLYFSYWFIFEFDTAQYFLIRTQANRDSLRNIRSLIFIALHVGSIFAQRMNIRAYTFVYTPWEWS